MKALDASPLRNGDLEGLKSALRYCMLKVGIRAANLPDEEEKGILIAHIIQEYGSHTPEEIRLAFDMAIAGKLNIDRRDVIAYENFSCLYFSGIMNAYRQWAAQAFRQIVGQLPPATKELTEKEKLEIDVNYVGALWQMKQREYNKSLLPPLRPDNA